jgi:GNAT superfamily N-acetyltransferase
VHPDYRFLEAAILAWAIEHQAGSAEHSADAAGTRQISVYCYEYDALRQITLAGLGFEKMDYGGMYRHMRLGCQPRPTVTVPAGYTLRTTQPQDMSNCQKIADLLNAAFNRNFHTGKEFHNFTVGAPSYDPELDLVMVAPDGSFAAYVGIAYDPDNGLGMFEPVCTHPDHQRHGLARTLMNEGLLRLWDRGAVHATVDTGDMVAANGLYTAMGFTEAYKGYTWKKVY